MQVGYIPMPTPRKPANILSINGAQKRNPGRLKARGKQTEDQRSIGRAPSGLTDAQRAAWRELVRNDPGVLTKADRIAVEMTARLMAEIRAGDTQASKQALLTQMLHKLGQTPQGRNYVSVPEKPERNPFADL